MQLVQPPTLQAELVPVPMKSKQRRGYEIQDVAFIDPHVTFARCFECKDIWQEMFLPDEDALEYFWNEQLRAGSPRLQNNPMTSVANWKRTFVPVFMHGDGCPVVGVGKSWGKSMDSFNWGSVLVRGCTKAVSMLICAIFLICQVQGFNVPHGGTMILECIYAFFLTHVQVVEAFVN